MEFGELTNNYNEGANFPRRHATSKLWTEQDMLELMKQGGTDNQFEHALEPRPYQGSRRPF